MKTVKILKGCHYSTEIFVKPLCWSKSFNRKDSRSYIFTDSCRYDIGEDQTDKNKLFGWSYGFHHKNSTRVTWWYDKINDCIRLCLYDYKDGVVVKKDLGGAFPLNEPISIELTTTEADNYITQTAEASFGAQNFKYFFAEDKMLTSYLPKWGYTLNLYFGGNRRAPHTIKIEKEQL